MKTIRTLAATLLATLALLVPGAAHATADSYQYTGQRTAGPQICLVTHGWRYWPAPTVAYTWSAAPVRVVADPTCAAYPRNRQLVMRTFYDSTRPACVVLGAGTWAYRPATTTHDSYWYPTAPTIYFNLSSRWAYRCTATTTQRAHYLSWAVGRHLGLAWPRATDPVATATESVMTSARPYPSSYDRWLVSILWRVF